MAQVVDLPLEDGGMLLVQSAAADEPSGGFGLASSTEEKAGKTLESALAHITPARQAVAGKFLPGDNYSFLRTDQPGMVTGSSQANARRWGNRHRPGPCVSASSSQTGTFA